MYVLSNEVIRIMMSSTDALIIDVFVIIASLRLSSIQPLSVLGFPCRWTRQYPNPAWCARFASAIALGAVGSLSLLAFASLRVGVSWWPQPGNSHGSLVPYWLGRAIHDVHVGFDEPFTMSMLALASHSRCPCWL